MKVSACVICKDEEKNIGACLESVRWADEIVVVDSGSADRTVEIARKMGARVIHHAWAGVGPQREFAIRQVQGDWVLCLDADERCTPELREAIRSALQKADGVAGFLVKRQTRYLGRWIRHGGWYPDWKLRLARPGSARVVSNPPHDRIEVDGPVKKLPGKLLHYTYGSFADHIRTINTYSQAAAESWARRGRRPSLLAMCLHPVVKFLEVYIWKRGFLDGRPGFIIAAASAFYTFARHVKLWEKVQGGEKGIGRRGEQAQSGTGGSR